MNRTTCLSCSVILIGLLGCSSSTDTENPTDIDNDETELTDDGKADSASKPLGTFNLVGGGYEGDWSRIVLKKDRTFHLERYPQGCPANAKSGPESFDGSYKLTRARKTSFTYITLKASGGTNLGRYQYTFTDGKSFSYFLNAISRGPLALSKVPWCNAQNDCVQQNNESGCSENKCGTSAGCPDPNSPNVEYHSCFTMDAWKCDDGDEPMIDPKHCGCACIKKTPKCPDPSAPNVTHHSCFTMDAWKCDPDGEMFSDPNGCGCGCVKKVAQCPDPTSPDVRYHNCYTADVMVCDANQDPFSDPNSCGCGCKPKSQA